MPVSSSHPSENCLAHKHTAGSQRRALISGYKQKPYFQPKHCSSHWNESVNLSAVPGLPHFPTLLINDSQCVCQPAACRIMYYPHIQPSTKGEKKTRPTCIFVHKQRE